MKAKRKWVVHSVAQSAKDENQARQRQWRNRQQAVNGNLPSLQTQEREAVQDSLPVSMDPGQIIMLTKMLTSADLRFYGFEDGAPVHRWGSGLL